MTKCRSWGGGVDRREARSELVPLRIIECFLYDSLGWLPFRVCSDCPVQVLALRCHP